MIMDNFTLDDFIVRAVIAGLGVAAISGPIGCFIVWRRMAYFGATLAHAALLGVALGFLFDVSINVGIIVICVGVSFLLVALQNQRNITTDTLLGILAHGALAAGLVVLSFMETVRVDLMAYLFGDILAVSIRDILWIYAGGTVCIIGLAALWPRLLAMTIHEDLARVEGVKVSWVRLFYMLLIAIVVAVGMKVVGMLLIISMLIIPAAVARQFAKTPEQMAIIASLVGMVSVGLGLYSSLQWDTPAGPSIVVIATLLFFLTYLLPSRQQAG